MLLHTFLDVDIVVAYDGKEVDGGSHMRLGWQYEEQYRALQCLRK